MSSTQASLHRPALSRTRPAPVGTHPKVNVSMTTRESDIQVAAITAGRGDEYNCLYVREEINSNLICGKCCCPFQCPVYCFSCKKEICQDCLEECEQNEAGFFECPYCMEFTGLFPCSLIVQNMVNEIPVKCCGCNVKMPISKEFDHYRNECQRKCQYAGCDVISGGQDGYSAHQATCPHRLMACEGSKLEDEDVRCDVELKVTEINLHEATCPRAKLKREIEKSISHNRYVELLAIEILQNGKLPSSQRRSNLKRKVGASSGC
jgi:hypothetical protein